MRACLCGLLLVTASLATAAAAERPNFVIVMTDDQRYDALGVVQREQGEAARFPWFETPNLDRLAREGTRFTNAFVVCSLCSPSRAAFLTGRYNHANGIVGNRAPLADDVATYASLLRASGYTTAYCGKWHMGSQSGQRPGFDYSASFVGQGQYMNCPVEINGEQTSTSGWIDDVSTDYAIDFIKQQRDKPFCLVLGFKTPHGPRVPAAVPPRLKGLYADVEIKPPVNADGAVPYRGTEGKRTAAKARAGRGVRGRPDMQEGTRIYFQLLQGVDQNVGRLLDTLDESGLAGNTVVVFTSDNGYFFGEHGLGDKRAAYEESLRIPLLVRLPNQKTPNTVDATTLNIDLAPTLLELAGVEIPEQMHGESLGPLLSGHQPDGWRTAFLYEYFEETRFPTPTVFAVRTPAAKLIIYPGHDDWTELYDLRADPHEMQNLADDPAHANMRQRMQAEFDRQATKVGLPLPPPREPPQS